MAGPAAPVVIVGILLRELLRRAARRRATRRNCRTGNCRQEQDHWHHEFPQQFRRFFVVLRRIDIDAPQNGRVIPAVEHGVIHAAGYNGEWDAFIQDEPTRGACMTFREGMVRAYHLYRYRRPSGRYPRK